MKIKTNSDGWKKEGEVAAWVEGILSHSINDGALERAQEVANNCAGAIGRLVEMLAEKGVLAAPEVFRVATGCHNDRATFEQDAPQTGQKGVDL